MRWGVRVGREQGGSAVQDVLEGTAAGSGFVPRQKSTAGRTVQQKSLNRVIQSLCLVDKFFTGLQRMSGQEFLRVQAAAAFALQLENPQ